VLTRIDGLITGRDLLPCMSPKVALRDILQHRAVVVAIGSIADIGCQPELAGSVAIDPSRTRVSNFWLWCKAPFSLEL
jgi:hypothetical protein